MTDPTSASNLEDRLLRICREIGLPVDTPDDDLFDAGATSLTVVRLLARTDAELGPDTVTAEAVFLHGTVRGIAAGLAPASTPTTLSAKR